MASAWAAGAIGDFGWDLAPSSLAHGVAQGGIAELGSGDFRSGFWAGAIGHAVSGTMQARGNGLMTLGNGGMRGIVARTAIGTVAGGTVSVLGGGKFANGAKTAAFVHLFNAESGSLFVKAKVNKLLQLGYDSDSGFGAEFMPGKGYKINLVDGVVTVTQGASIWSFGGDVAGGGFSVFGERPLSMSLTVSPASGGNVTFSGSISYNPTVFGLTAGGKTTINLQSVMMNSSGLLGQATRAIQNRSYQIDCAVGGGC